MKFEPFDEHRAQCKCEHWKILKQYVWARDSCSVSGNTVCVLRRGSILCLGLTSDDRPFSIDGKWIRCTRDAKVWVSAEEACPIPLLQKKEQEFGYVLREHPQLGTLVQFLPPRGSLGSEAPLRRAVPEPVASEHSGDFTSVEHWDVGVWGAWIHTEPSVYAPVEFKMQMHDVLVLGPQPPRIRIDKGNWWLHVQEGSQVYRQGEELLEMLGAGGFKRYGFVLVEDGTRTYATNVPAVGKGMVITMVSGFGEPWVVNCHELAVLSEPEMTSEDSGTKPALGVVRCGDIVGVRRQNAKWLELVSDSDVREATDEGKLRRFNDLTEVSISETKGPAKDRRFYAELPVLTPQRAWVPAHGRNGQLSMERCRADLDVDCLVRTERRQIYQEVIELCHNRIYEENLEGLWDGERSKLPTPKSLEAKLFDASTTVLHACKDDELVGGAIVKECLIKALAVSSTAGALSLGKDRAGLEGCPGRTPVGYMDSCAAEPGSHAGSALWELVSKMCFVCVACHSILLQKTVDFWQSRGMRRFDPDSSKDCDEFRSLVIVHTQGKLICELPDLVEALPASRLPLFVWVSPRSAEAQDDADGASRIFVPDDPDSYYFHT